MTTLDRYWNLVRLDSAGNTKVTEISRAKKFCQQQFPNFIDSEEISNTVIQYDFVTNLQNSNDEAKIWSNRCLRCFISHQIKYICIQLALQFGREHDFTSNDLFIYTLNDTLDNFRDSTIKKLNNNKYKPLAVEVLEKFDPKKANLSTWTTRIVKQNREVQRFLLERGVYLISNWAILNDTNSKQVRRILTEFHNLTSEEIEQAVILLESYHGIYRRDRIASRQSKGGKCQTPSEVQLTQIAALIEGESNLELSIEQTLSNLEQLATLLREYRIYVRGGRLKKEQSLDNSEINTEGLQAAVISQEVESEESSTTFLQVYQKQFQASLKQSIVEVISFKLSKFKGKKIAKVPQYLTALELFHCQGKAMGEIASLVGLQAQYQVTRLLKLKELRADIRHKTLQIMGDWILNKTEKFTNPETLKSRERVITEALTERVDNVFIEAEKEVSVPGSNSSILAREICNYLDTKTEKAI